MPRPKSMKKTAATTPHTKKPDIDNLLKAVMDALTDIKIWRDDSFVCLTHSSKWYAGGRSGAHITICTGFNQQEAGKNILEKEVTQ
jgi:Holliday junction resolvase RusA-like endonuclease